MKKIIFILCLLPIIGFSQVCDSIKITPINFTPVVVELNSKSSSEIYSKIKSWANRYYKNPDLVIKADEKDNYIRIHAGSTFDFKQVGLFIDNYIYDLEILIKENKYKIQFLNVVDISTANGDMPNSFYKKNGELRGFKKVNLKMQKCVLNSLNEIHYSLFNFINSVEKDF